MRIPKSPVSFFVETGPKSSDQWQHLVQVISSDEVRDFVRRSNDDYLHWDKLRRYPMPNGIKPEEMWVAVELSRTPQFRRVGISETTTSRFKFWTPPKHQEWLHRIDQDAGGNIGSRSRIVPRDSGDRFLLNSLMEEAIASSQLEGASTTRDVAKQMLRTKRRPKNRHERMIANNYNAILEIRDMREQPLTPEMLCHIHEVITDQTLDDPSAAGRFRTKDDPEICVVDNYTQEILHKPPIPSVVPGRIEELCEFANEIDRPFIHPVLKAIMLHFAIGYIHPFVDGNGRTARAVFYWYMLKNFYWIFEYLPISRIVLDSPGKYAKAYLYTETDNGDLTYFIHYNLRIIDRAVREMNEYFERQQEILHQARDMIDGMDLNHRQLSVAYHAIEKPSSKFTISHHAGTHDIALATARTDLHGLEQAGILEKRKDGKYWLFVPAANFRQRIQKSAFRAVSKSPRRTATAITQGHSTPLPMLPPQNSLDPQKQLFEDQ